MKTQLTHDSSHCGTRSKSLYMVAQERDDHAHPEQVLQKTREDHKNDPIILGQDKKKRKETNDKRKQNLKNNGINFFYADNLLRVSVEVNTVMFNKLKYYWKVCLFQ